MSYWHKTSTPAVYPRLEENLETDNLIIGAGITGMTAAYLLAKKGIGTKTVLIEAGGLCDGTTGNTTAKISIQHDLIYSRLIKEQSLEAAKLYAQSQQEAAEFITKTVRDEKIECDFMGNSSLIYAENEEEATTVENENDAAVKVGIMSNFCSNPAFPKNAVASVAFPNQAVFHPIKYVSALSQKATEKSVKIYCSTKAVAVKDDNKIRVETDNGVTITCKNLIMATQYPIYDGLGFYFSRLYPQRGYAVAATPSGTCPDDSFKNSGSPTRSIRKTYNGNEAVAIGQGDTHYTGRRENMHECFENITSFINDEVGVDKILARWSAQDYETPDGIPFIGRIGKNSHIYVAAGFAKWGMTNGTLAAMIITDIITAGGNRFEELYSPLRKILPGAGKMASEVTSAVGELVKSKIEKNDGLDDIKPGEGRVITYKGKKAGLYLDEDGIATIVDITCSHMKTTLNFNSAETTWDCPAHGGRYSIDGRLLEGPPKHSLKVLYHGKYGNLFEKD